VECSAINNVGVREVMERAVEVSFHVSEKKKFNISKLKHTLIKKKDYGSTSSSTSSSSKKQRNKLGSHIEDDEDFNEHVAPSAANSSPIPHAESSSVKLRKITRIVERNSLSKLLQINEYIALCEYNGRKRRVHLQQINDAEHFKLELFHQLGIHNAISSSNGGNQQQQQHVASKQQQGNNGTISYTVEYFDELFQDYVELETLDTVTRLVKLRLVNNNNNSNNCNGNTAATVSASATTGTTATIPNNNCNAPHHQQQVQQQQQQHSNVVPTIAVLHNNS